ncbi:MAG: nucleotidyltransferase family protein [Desulfobacterales bacterium]
MRTKLMDKAGQIKSANNFEVVGLIPAAGKASRISPLPCSKELIPIGFGKMADDSLRPKVVSHYLLDKFSLAGASKVYFILRNGKWDIPAYYGDGTMMAMDFAYLLMNLPYGVPYTLDQAYPFVREAKVMMGFPDMLYGPDHAFILADQTLIKKGADLVIGLYPVKDDHQVMKCDMVQWDMTTGRIEKIVIKPKLSNLKYSWVFAIWTPKFTQFMHDYLQIERNEHRDSCITKEIHLGHVVQQAITAGLRVYGHAFSNYKFIDIGTPNELDEAYKEYRNTQTNERQH